METKNCTRCSTEKPVADFFKEKRNTGKKGKGVAAICKVCCQERHRKWYDNNQDYHRDYNKEYYSKNKTAQKAGRYGLTEETYRAMLVAQGGKCQICGRLQKGKSLAIDHDHKTGAVRGLLCESCNNGLGRFKDSPEILEAALAYLKKAI